MLHGGRSRDRTTGRVRVHRGAHTAATLPARSLASDCSCCSRPGLPAAAIRRPARATQLDRRRWARGAARRGTPRHRLGSARLVNARWYVRTYVRTCARRLLAHLSRTFPASRSLAPDPRVHGTLSGSRSLRGALLHTSVYQPPAVLLRLSSFASSSFLPRRPQLCASFLIYDV